MTTENLLPFSKKLAENLDDLDDRVFRKNKASLIIVDGGVGEGKTTKCVHIMDYINYKHDFQEVDLGEKACQLAMGGEDFTKKLVICFGRKLPTCTYDEAGDFHKRGSMTRLNALINRTFETYRAFKVLVIIALPSFHVLDQDIFDKEIPRLLIHLYGRTMNQGNGRCYSLNGMLKLRAKMEKLKHFKKHAYKLVEPNFFIHFKNLSDARSKALDILSTRGKIKGLKQAEIKFEGLVNYSELSKKVGRSEIWVKKVVNELKIHHVKVFEKRYYFPASAVDNLLDYLDDKGK
jgi:Mor family transcriptional regulator